MYSFKAYIEERSYFEAIDIIESGEYLNEGFLDTISGNVKKKIEFIKSIAKAGNKKLEDVVKMFKDKKVFQFFAKIKFSLKKLYSMAKKGWKVYTKFESVISEYIASTKVVKWTSKELKRLDDYLMKHPNIKAFAGVAVSALLIFIWLNMSFTPDLEYSMSFDDIVSAATGSFSLSDLFSGPEGVKLLTYFATGAILGLSFPWPGPTSVQFVSGMLFSISKKLRGKT